MNFTVVKTIYFKEVLDTLRDKRTLIAMVGVPIFLYPFLILVMMQVALVQQTRIAETESKIFVRGPEAETVRTWLEDVELISLVPEEDLASGDTELIEGEIDAIVSAKGPVSERLAGNETVEIEIQYDSTASSSRKAVDRLYKALGKQDEKILNQRLKEKELTESFADPIKTDDKDVAPPSKRAGMVLGTLLPIMMVIMLAVGAFYPAVDLTAGEKERGTFETLLSTPTSKLEIVCGKFLTVFTLAMATGILNLASITATLWFQLHQISSEMQKQPGFDPDEGNVMSLSAIELPPESILAMAIVLIPLAFFISATMMAVAVLAKSFKEAQNYVTPVFIFIMLPAMLGAVPDIKLDGATQLIPIGNIALLFRDLLMARASVENVFIVFMCTAAYAAIAVVVATWMFQREEVIFAEERGLPLTLRRSEITPRATPTPGAAMGIFGVCMLLLFYGAGYVQSQHLQFGILITEFLLLLAPVLFLLWYARVNIRETLNLKPASIPTLVGAALIMGASLPLVIQVGALQNRVLPMPEEFERFAEQLFNIGNATWSVPALLFVIAVSPAICEEALFRGVLVSGFRQRMPGWAVVLVVGVLFGLFHLSVYRVVPTGFLGILLTYIAVRGGSIYPCMLGHFLVNGTSVLIQTQTAPSGLLRYLEERQVDVNGLPIGVLVIALLVVVLGVVFVEWSARAKAVSESRSRPLGPRSGGAE